jgi:hypothetical protein
VSPTNSASKLKMYPGPAAIAIVQALLLATGCQFFVVDPENRDYLTNGLVRSPTSSAAAKVILTRGDILGRPEQADLEPVEDLIDGNTEHVSKYSA